MRDTCQYFYEVAPELIHESNLLYKNFTSQQILLLYFMHRSLTSQCWSLYQTDLDIDMKSLFLWKYV